MMFTLFLSATLIPHVSKRYYFTVSPWKEKQEFIEWENQEVVQGCEWVGTLVSQMRINYNSEEVAPGYKADAARATLWKVRY